LNSSGAVVDIFPPFQSTSKGIATKKNQDQFNFTFYKDKDNEREESINEND